ncbi:hypothetical protein WMY93_019400 [Mugilogobius chulae]|uniref:Uncharacterized protein n=1 Tax=Mugilogobius chulae TaxID=88201 RepID=A0AAW0NQ43_9GOBI
MCRSPWGEGPGPDNQGGPRHWNILGHTPRGKSAEPKIQWTSGLIVLRLRLLPAGTCGDANGPVELHLKPSDRCSNVGSDH